MTAASIVLTSVLVLVTGYYAVTTHQLLNQARIEREDRDERDASEQARLVGGFVEAHTRSAAPAWRLIVQLRNASPLPVRAPR